MIESLIEDIKIAQEMVQDLRKKAGIIHISIYDNKVQVTSEAFYKNFTNYIAANRADGSFPLQIEKEISGIKFFAVLDKEEAKAELKEAI